MSDKEISSLIKRRRLQVWVHSIIYYEFDENMIEDWQWTAWATELYELQQKYPEISTKTEYYEIFKDFDGSTGHFLPLRDSRKISTAMRLLNYRQKKG